MKDPIWMEHPNLPGRKVQQPRKAFEAAWERRGWVECDPPTKSESLEAEETQEEESQILEDISYADDELPAEEE